MPVTATSYPFGAADHQLVPQHLGRVGYVEEEYLVRGHANVYSWPAPGPAVVRTPDAPYTTRVLVRMPAKPRRFSGNVVVEMLNPSNLFDLNIGWALSDRQFIRNDDAWVGITAKPITVAPLKTFDPVRYGSLSFANPLPLSDPRNCTDIQTVVDPPALRSRSTEDGLIWDINSQVGAWLRSGAKSNPLADGRKHRRRSLVERAYGFGYSQSGGYLVNYINAIQPRVVADDGKPIYDGFARSLNAEGLKTVRGKDWTTRRIRQTLINPYYAGWVTAYGERIKGDHEPLIDPARWERIMADRRRLDRVAAQRRRGGRQPREEYLLGRIAFCGDCGRALYTRRLASGRHYLCAAVREARGTCAAARIPADVAEAQVLARLRTFVGDVEQWVSSRAAEANRERELFAAAIQEQRSELARIERRAERPRAQHAELLDEGNELAATALRQVARIEPDCDERLGALAQAERRLAEWDSPDVDAALDYYAELRNAIAGRIDPAESVRDLNTALRTVLEGVWLRTVADEDLGHVLIAHFVLRADPDTGRPPDISLATPVDYWRRILDDDQPIIPPEHDPGTTLTSDPVSFRDATPSYEVSKNPGVAIPAVRVPLEHRRRR